MILKEKINKGDSLKVEVIEIQISRQKNIIKKVDELLYMDAVASLYGRNNLKEHITKAVKDVFIPITVGGGIRRLKMLITGFRAGADSYD